MPIYRFRTFPAAGLPKEQEIGFYQDAAASAHARRIARDAPVEVWRGTELVVSYGERSLAEPEVA